MRINSGFEVRDKGIFYWVDDWSKYVHFGRDKAHGVGGRAFEAAAIEQQRRIKAASRARARLRAAAPDLLEALLEVYADIEIPNVKGGSDQLEQQVAAAIAKATGGQP